MYFLAGGKPRQVVKTACWRPGRLRSRSIEPWLFDECYQAVGDLAETIAHMLPRGARVATSAWPTGSRSACCRCAACRDEEIAARVAGTGANSTRRAFLLTKLVGGGFRVGVSKLLVQRARWPHAGIDAKRVAQRMMGYTDGKVHADAGALRGADRAARRRASASRSTTASPIPSSWRTSSTLPPELFALGSGRSATGMVEWKYDGIRGQVSSAAGKVWIWSRGEELVTERFPEIVALASALPDGTVLDGEILVWKEPILRRRVAAGPPPFALLQQRIGRKT